MWYLSLMPRASGAYGCALSRLALTSKLSLRIFWSKPIGGVCPCETDNSPLLSECRPVRTPSELVGNDDLRPSMAGFNGEAPGR